MKPITSVSIWLGELLLLCVVYSLICAFMPDVLLYNIYTEKFGFLTEEQWYDRYIFTLALLSLFSTTLVIWLIARYMHTRNK